MVVNRGNQISLIVVTEDSIDDLGHTTFAPP